MRRISVLLVALAFGLVGCDSGGESASPADNGAGESTLAASGEFCTTTLDCAGSLVCYEQACMNPTELNGQPSATTSAKCGLDLEKLGKEVGAVVGNFSLPDQDGQTYELYDACESDKKAVWVVLAAGW